ncbi:hypothetical protein, partial [Algoriphagus boritolerans]|uniref:Por secretion system C-terminal sorting domain-containing protein n=1 Tax=Algoriphagus boritolerans DSM 17298 = JCM 18970 TaxID=1120964 RepID=A0A1H5Y9N5_9BACT
MGQLQKASHLSFWYYSKIKLFWTLAFSDDSKIKSEIFKYSGGQEIDISALPKGDYILQIIYEGKIIHQARFIVSK